MNKLKLSLSYFKEHKLVFRTAVIITIVIVVALFCSQREESDFSGQFISRHRLPVKYRAEMRQSLTEKTRASRRFMWISGDRLRIPGLYCKEGTRVFEVIEKAGGLTEDAFY